MLPCVMIGDSIAVGVGQARPECVTVAKVGITSGRYIATLLPRGPTVAETAVISLGVNDGSVVETLDNLREVRGRIEAGTVVWLLPGLKEEVRAMIRAVAAENGDRTLDTRPEAGRDHLHPTRAGYERIAARTVGAETGVEVAYAAEDDPRPLRGAATPRDRIRKLRALRHAEIHTRGRHHATLHAPDTALHARAARPTGRTKVVAACTHPPRLCGTGHRVRF